MAIKYQNLNGTILKENILEIMNNPKYMEKAKLMSQRYRDQPIDPLEKAIYWTEYVLRHQGAEFLQSPAKFLNYWQKNSWDCAAVYLGVLLLSVFLTMKIFSSFVKSFTNFY